ncbi:MAG: hypothetical protein VX848_03355 [Verrucomicrobiota bacterium]|nr:hypothetical protein [Verrucomicrobiota bacterium]
MRNNITRRRFLNTTTFAGTCISMPQLLLGQKSSKEIIIGEGQYRFEVQHDWAKLPDKYSWQTTHNVAVDAEGLLYVIHEGHANKKDHPSIFVFDQKGKFVRAFGERFQGGGHGIEVRKEGTEEFLYVCSYQQVKSFAKLTLKGNTVWENYAPMESGVYRRDEDTVRVKRWGRDAFMPTNFAFLDDGGFLLADGYGSFCIHRYDKDANWVSKFGGPGKGEGTFNTPHGIWIDRRSGRVPQIVVCDRAHHSLQYFTMDGKYIETLKGYGLPANIDSWKDLLLVPELQARVTLLNDKNEVVAKLGEDVERVTKKVKGVRNDSKKWLPGKFIHPHDACFDNDGNIFVAEWVSTGRVSRLRRLN